MYIATCIEGLEEIACEELKGKKICPGRIEFQGDIKNFNSVKDVYLLWKNFKFEKLNEIISEANGINEEIGGTFKVTCKREGDQNFSSMEVERAVGEVFYNKGFKVDLKNPERIIFVDVKENMCFIGLLIKKGLNRRDWRFKRIQPNLDCTIAYAMVKLADIRENEIVFNPYCKDGVIAIEAARNSSGILYCDDGKNNLRNAEINIRLSETEVKICIPEKPDKIMAILPSYVRRMSKNKVNSILRDFFERFGDVKRIVAISGMGLEDFKGNMSIIKTLKLTIGESRFIISVLGN